MSIDTILSMGLSAVAGAVVASWAIFNKLETKVTKADFSDFVKNNNDRILKVEDSLKDILIKFTSNIDVLSNKIDFITQGIEEIKTK